MFKRQFMIWSQRAVLEVARLLNIWQKKMQYRKTRFCDCWLYRTNGTCSVVRVYIFHHSKYVYRLVRAYCAKSVSLSIQCPRRFFEIDPEIWHVFHQSHLSCSQMFYVSSEKNGFEGFGIFGSSDTKYSYQKRTCERLSTHVQTIRIYVVVQTRLGRSVFRENIPTWYVNFV